MNDRGDALVVWTQVDSGGDIEQTYLSERRDGVWYHPSHPDDYISVIGSDSQPILPVAAMDGRGNSLVVWAENAWDVHDVGTRNNLYLAEYR